MQKCGINQIQLGTVQENVNRPYQKTQQANLKVSIIEAEEDGNLSPAVYQVPVDKEPGAILKNKILETKIPKIP